MKKIEFLFGRYSQSLPGGQSKVLNKLLVDFFRQYLIRFFNSSIDFVAHPRTYTFCLRHPQKSSIGRAFETFARLTIFGTIFDLLAYQVILDAVCIVWTCEVGPKYVTSMPIFFSNKRNQWPLQAFFLVDILIDG